MKEIQKKLSELNGELHKTKKEPSASDIAVGCSVIGLGFVAMFVLFSALGTIPVYLIWNHVLIKVIDGLSQVTFLQAWAISIFIGLFRVQNINTNTSS
jgi:hypothetical protein